MNFLCGEPIFQLKTDPDPDLKRIRLVGSQTDLKTDPKTDLSHQNAKWVCKSWIPNQTQENIKRIGAIVQNPDGNRSIDFHQNVTSKAQDLHF